MKSFQLFIRIVAENLWYFQESVDSYGAISEYNPSTGAEIGSFREITG